MTGATVIGSAGAARPSATAAAVGVLVGLLWLTVLGLASVAGWVWLRDRDQRAALASSWPTRTAWATATAFVVTIGVLVTGAAD
jgi:hypothetical protein